MKTRRTRIAILVASVTLAAPPVALAAVLGEITSLSAIGSPLRVEINVLDGRIDRAGDCLRIVAPGDSGQDLPVVKRARISATGRGTTARIVISSSEPMLEPAVQLAIENICDTRLRRDYTLLLPYPSAMPPLPAAAPARTPRPESARKPARGDRSWSTAAGESLTSLASALYPKDAATRRQFIRETARANPDLFPNSAAYRDPLPAGTRIVIPDLSRIARTTTPRPSQAQAPARPAPRTAPATDARKQQDRLIVAPEDQAGPHAALPLSERPAGGGDKGSGLDSREQEIAAAIDRSIVNQMELLARIKELEQIQNRLMAQANQLERTATSPSAAPNTAQASPAAPSPPPAPVQATPSTPENRSNWLLVAALALLALAIAAALILRSRRSGSEHSPSTAGSAGQSPATGGDPETLSPPQPMSSAHVGGVASLEWDQSSAALDTRSLAPLAAEEEVEEHDSAIELAEIMMSFGRVHGAAETLAEFIRGNPKQAVTPWLKLLEVYRAAGLRAEFDGLARQLNKTFNVKAVTWDNFDAARSAPDSLEKMPHLIATLQNLWGTRECQSYLHRLLRDNRDGTREGFPLNAIDEILCLSAVLEQLLGPYRPLAEAPVPDATSTVPPG